MEEEKKKMKMAILGPAEEIRVYGAFGIERMAVSDPEEAERRLAQLAQEDYAVILVTENLVRANPNLVTAYQTKPLPSVIVLPSAREEGETKEASIGYQILRDSARTATGIDILGKF